MSTEPSDDVPFLPDVEPTPPPAAPTLPPAAPVSAEPVEPQPFDARAMVEATTHKVDTPAYGGLPKATPEGIEATRRLRAAARRKRQRNRLIAWAVVAVFIGGIVAAGWFAYVAYQDDQDRKQAEREAAEAAGDSGEPGIAPGALTPLGNQQQVIDALEDVNSADGRLSGGGLRDIVDQAQTAVDEANGEDVPATTVAPALRAVAVDLVLPPGAVSVANRLDDVEGFERYVVNVDLWAAADGLEYSSWRKLMETTPQVSGSSPVFDVLPPVKRGEVAIAVRRDGGELVRALVTGLEPDLSVEFPPPG